jgi:hypothetical protein
MVADLGVSGTPEQAREQLDAVRSQSIVDEPVVVVPMGIDEEMQHQTVEALAP